MVNQDRVNTYMNSLMYSANRPRFSETIVSSINIDKILEADTDTKLLTLGSLLATNKFVEFALLLQQLNFSNIPPEERSLLANYIFTAFSEYLLANHKTSSYFAEAILKLLVALSPELVLSHELNRLPLNQKPLVELNYAHNINTSISGVVFFREFTFGPGSRKHELGHRIQSALTPQKWDVSLLPLQDILNYSSTHKRDFVLIDIAIFSQITRLDDIGNILSYLKRYFRKIIIIEPDSWTGFYDKMLILISDYVDYIWGFSADWSLISEPCYRGKCILFPSVGGFDHLEDVKLTALDWNTCTFNFTGSVQGYNLNRTYWILESIHRNLPIDIRITRPGIDDGLDHESSLELYAQSLASTHAALNLTTRKDGSRIITGRSVEIISLNRLLIQERCQAFQSYYVDGEHFLEFVDIEGLCTIVEFLRSHPRVAQRICSQGHQFYQERYSCRKLVEHLQTLL